MGSISPIEIRYSYITGSSSEANDFSALNI